MEQNIVKRRTRLAFEQREALLSFMEKHPALATGRFPGPQGAKIKAQLWNELSDYLNTMGSMGQGTTKTPDRWMKSWQDWRCDVKAKAWRLRSQNGLGSGTAQLTPIEERLLTFMGTECQDDHMMSDPLDVQSEHYSDDNTHEYSLAMVDNGAMTVDISSPSPSGSHHVSPVPSSSLSPPVACTAQSTSSYPPASCPSSSLQQSSQFSSSPPHEGQNQKPSQRTLFNISASENMLLSRKRPKYYTESGENELLVYEDETAEIISERAAVAIKTKAAALDLEAAAEERKAAAAERRATALEREAAAAERKAAALEREAAALEREAAAVERKAAAAEREASILGRRPVLES